MGVGWLVVLMCVPTQLLKGEASNLLGGHTNSKFLRLTIPTHLD